ncbi:MAG: divergent polysaccharide deacetylase family protein [Nitrospinae bacterium]|nr:divergent polysaccharide deacetylase family protein [Nitrospinota bacterium]
MKKKPAPARRRMGVLPVLVIVFFAGGVFAAWLIARYHAAPVEKKIAAPYSAGRNADAGAAAVAPPPAMPPKPGERGKRLAIIIDDIGLRRDPVEKLLAAGIPLTFSVMPDQPRTKELAAEIAAAGQEVMLHLPMEPENDRINNPGAGALLVTEPDEDIRAAIRHDLGQVPQAKGVNNHMGSLFTRDERKMEVVLAELKARNLYFVDSLTAPTSVGHAVARRLGLKSAARRVFLDNDPSAEAIAQHLRLAIGLAVKEGAVVAIGHPYPATVAAIEKLKDELVKAGVTPVFASQVVR